MAAVTQAPSGLNADPSAYLALACINNSLDFPPSSSMVQRVRPHPCPRQAQHRRLRAIPLAACTRWMSTVVLAFLTHMHIARFAVLSHSNGLFYALYALLHLQPTLSRPLVPQSISGSIGLHLARAATLPGPLPNTLGSILQLL
ncbi:hypothetical protein FB451DRAFT_1392696 [Mycena latifolia]|nr:hypothetical protein FB451DRAFT_1392696 [Mycena latifolia]